MTIEEAIGELEALKDKLEKDCMSYACQATQLGIEALESVRDRRNSPALLVGAGAFAPLPSETEK